MSSHHPLMGQFWEKTHKKGNTQVIKNICSSLKSHNDRFAVVGTIVNFLLTGTLLVLIQVGSLSAKKNSIFASLTNLSSAEVGNYDMKATPFQYQLENKT